MGVFSIFKSLISGISVLILILGTIPVDALSQKAFKLQKVSEQLIDFEIFSHTLLNNHVGLYRYNDSIQINRKLNLLQNELQTPRSLIDLYGLYSRFISDIGCGHTIITHKKLFKNYLYGFQVNLPFESYFVNKKLFVKNDFNDGNIHLSKYDQIISIDGQAVSDLLKELYEYLPSDGKNETFKDKMLNRAFNQFLFLHTGQQEKYSIAHINHAGDTLISEIFTVEPTKDKLFSFIQRDNEYNVEFQKKYFPHRSIAILTLPSPLPNDADYREAIDEFFLLLDHYEIKNLIIDLRNNLGGLPQTYLASYLTDTSYVYVRNNIKYEGRPLYSDYIKDRLNYNHFSLKFFNFFTHKSEGASLEIEPRANPFQGRSFVLQNGMTFSAASNLSSNLKEKSGTIILGDESGGGYSSCNSGNMVLELPYSKFRININPIYFDNLPNNEYDLDGVTPHIYLPEDEKWDNETDVQMNVLMRMIEELEK